MNVRRKLSVVVTCLALLGAAIPKAAGQTTSQADVAVVLRGPSATPAVGDVFDVTITVSNSGPSSAENVVLVDHLPNELELRSAVAAQAGASCTEGVSYPEKEPLSAEGGSGGGGSSPEYRERGVTCDLGTLSSGALSLVKLTLQRTGARETYNGASVSSPTQDPNYENNYDDLFFAADRSNPADVGVRLTGPRAPDVGSTFSYEITVVNNGPSRADSVVLTDSGGGVRIVQIGSSDPTDTCTKTFEDPEYGYFELRCELGSLVSGASTSIGVTAERTSPYEIYNSAFVSTSNFDDNFENDYADHIIAADPSVTSDLTVTATGPARTPLVGENFQIVFTVGNTGPATAPDVSLNDYLTEGLEFVSVEPSDKCSYNPEQSYGDEPASAPAREEGDAYYPVTPSGLYCALGSMAPGASVTISLTVTRTKARELWNSAWVSSSNHDPMYEDNYSELVIPPDKSNPVDLIVSLQAPDNPPVDSGFDITMGVTNRGPARAEDVSLSSYLPYGLEFESVTPSDCTFHGGSDEPRPLPARETTPEASPSPYAEGEIRCDFGAVAAGERRSATVSVTRLTEYEIWASAWTSTTNYDENYENDYASVLIQGKPYPGACPPSGGSIQGSRGPDSIIIGDCDIATGGGGDSVEAAPSSYAGDSNIKTGKGADVISVVLSTSGDRRRRIVVDAGRGADTLMLRTAPGIRNATVIFAGNDGNDTFHLEIAPGARRLRVVVRGQSGEDVMIAKPSDEAGGVTTGVTAYGGTDRDLLEAGDGSDVLLGGAGRDRLFGGLGDDTLAGGRGRDVCRGGPGRDTISRC